MLANTLFLHYKRELVTNFIVTITSFNKSKTIVKSLTPPASTTIIPIFSNVLTENYGGQLLASMLLLRISKLTVK
jgi:hypothetical protein